MTKEIVKTVAWFVALIAVLAVALTGCEHRDLWGSWDDLTPSTTAECELLVSVGLASNLFRCVDHEARMVCYLHGSGGGVDCVPISETYLEVGR